jgi:hypothetical protein
VSHCELGEAEQALRLLAKLPRLRKLALHDNALAEAEYLPRLVVLLPLLEEIDEVDEVPCRNSLLTPLPLLIAIAIITTIIIIIIIVYSPLLEEADEVPNALALFLTLALRSMPLS